MDIGNPITTNALVAEARRPVYRALSPGAAMLVIALDHRMNSNTVLATVEATGPSRDPSTWFASWLDAGAPGLAAAARACDWEGHFDRVVPGPAPTLRLLSLDAFVARLDWLLGESCSFYHRTLADPVAVRAAFVDAELGEAADRFRFYEVDAAEIAPRLDYFDGLGNDACLLWTDGERMGVLFTNGSD